MSYKRWNRQKSFFALVIIAIMLLCYSTAFAVTYDEWIHKCVWKTARVTYVYNDHYCETTPIDVLPANTYVKVSHATGGFYDGTHAISAMLSNGTIVSGYVKSSDIVTANVYWVDEKGQSYGINENVYRELYGSASNSTKPKGNGNSKPTATAEPAPPVKLNDKEVQISQLGVETSIVVLEGEKQTIATADLVFSQDSKDDKHTAVIFAPNTGKCTLRSKGADNGAALKQCKAGIIVGVLEYGSKYTKINYQGNVGYVLTSCLKFYKKDVQSIGTGTIIYSKDKPNVKTTINVRNKTDKASAKVAEWNTGTEVIIFSHSDGWYEVEYNGIHGYIMDTYIKAE